MAVLNTGSNADPTPVDGTCSGTITKPQIQLEFGYLLDQSDTVMSHFDRNNFRLERSLGQYIHLLNLYKDKLLGSHPDMQDITVAQFKVLLLLSRVKTMKPSDLWQTLQVDSAAITRMLDRLEKKGLILRERSTTDRRQIDIRLSAQGKAVARRIPQIAADTLNQLTDCLSEKELTQFMHLLVKILRHGHMLPDA
jgi:DNA-binding MarR family transcriptional regulator